MTENELLEILRSEGWHVEKDEVGDAVCRRVSGDTVLQIIPAIIERKSHFRVSLMPLVSSLSFSKAVDYIVNQKNGYEPIIVSNFSPEKIECLSSEDIVRLSQQAISWANDQDIEAGLTKYRELPTSSKGALALRHLAALAIHGDTERLSFYKKSFDSGDRLGFIPYITIEIIERSLALASEKKSS